MRHRFLYLEKPMKLPEFAEGVHYRQLQGGRYRFELLDDITLQLAALEENQIHLSCRDFQRREWVRIERNRYTIRSGYRWNGSSPKWWFPLLGWVGTPDPIRSRLASCWHDTAFQFLRVADFPLGYVQSNQVFHKMMVASGFRLANIYHFAVRDFGQHFCGEFPERGEHSVLL